MEAKDIILGESYLAKDEYIGKVVFKVRDREDWGFNGEVERILVGAAYYYDDLRPLNDYWFGTEEIIEKIGEEPQKQQKNKRVIRLIRK